MVLAGCGTQHAGSPAGRSTMAATSASAPSPAQRAAADAASLLTRFRPPPGALRTGRLPVSWLSQAPQWPMSPDLVTRTAWWRAAGQPQTVLAWVRAHPPSGLTISGSGMGPGSHMDLRPGEPPPAPDTPLPGTRMWYTVFSQPAMPGGQLLVAVASDGNGHTAIRVDAQVVWLPAKPAAERIPSAAKIVTITPVPGFAPVSAHDQTVTITDPAAVAKIAAVIDALPVFPPGERSCPLFQGRGMRLTFRAAPAGPALAVVTGDTTGCGTVAVIIDGRPMLALGQATSMQQQVMAIAGIRWAGFPAD